MRAEPSSFLLITTCTSRKKAKNLASPISPTSLLKGNQHHVTERWVDLVQSTRTSVDAVELYSGRGFKEAVDSLSGENDRLWIISAGMGLINANDLVPNYDLTVVPGAVNCVQSRLEHDAFNASRWWRDINIALRSGNGIADLVNRESHALVILTLTNTYAELVRDDIGRILGDSRDRVRIVGTVSPYVLPHDLRDCWMPYDRRFDGPDSPMPGTRSDYPQRASKHFIEKVIRDNISGSIKEHKEQLSDLLARLRDPVVSPARVRLSDIEIIEIITRRWDDARGSNARMLRILRDEELVSCEQSRFAQIFRSVKKGIM